jgi:N6-L-threonylcarbamoyladenine synthase
MVVLGIETSCDETGLALVEYSPGGVFTVTREVLASQVSLHELYGGVVPELASREHMRSLPILSSELFKGTGCSVRDLAAIAVTCGPGLKGCLLIGVMFAAGISSATGIPLFPVNHIEGHILSAELHNPTLRAPYLALVVSGGHTELVRVQGVGRYSIVHRTQDDAAGEAFDKSANLLGLPYPGGPRLAALADSVTTSRFTLPKVAREISDFSFSGLKTAVMLLVQRNKDVLEQEPAAKAELAWAVQNAILDPLIVKTVREVRRTKLPLAVCGGVSANKELRKRLIAECGEDQVIFPPMKHCVDNGAMIAYTAARYLAEGVAAPPLDIKSRWPVELLSSEMS